MLGMNAALNPPPVPLSDEAMKLAAVLLAVAADPAGTKSRLDELNAATTTLRAEIDGHAAAKKSADDAAAALADLQERERNLAAREDALIRDSARLQAASAAIQDRDQTVKDREAASDRRAAEIEARAKALDDRLEAYRKALA